MTPPLPPHDTCAWSGRAARGARRAAWALATLLLVVGTAQAAGVYKWKDAQGNTHFSDTPPAGTTQAVPVKPATTSKPAAPANTNVGSGTGAGLTEAQRLALRERFNTACSAGVESPACLQARREVSQEMQKDCAPQHSPAFCAQGTDAIVRDMAQQIAGESPNPPPTEAERNAERTARAEQTRAHECTTKRETVARHKARLQSDASAGLTPEQRAQQSGLIRAIETELEALGCP